MTIANATSKCLSAVLLASAAAVPASALESNARVAQEGGPKIMMPIPTPGPVSGVTGCWTADEKLYGYRLSFCVQPSGAANYTVTGNGLYCHAETRMAANVGKLRLHNEPHELRRWHGLVRRHVHLRPEGGLEQRPHGQDADPWPRQPPRLQLPAFSVGLSSDQLHCPSRVSILTGTSTPSPHAPPGVGERGILHS